MCRAQIPEFFECGGCDCWHPYGWSGDCRNDAMRYTLDRLEEEYGLCGTGWIEVCEFCRSTGHSSWEHGCEGETNENT